MLEVQLEADRWRDYVAEPMVIGQTVRIWRRGGLLQFDELRGVVQPDGLTVQRESKLLRPGSNMGCYRAGYDFTYWRPAAKGPDADPARLLFLVDNGESNDEHREFQIASDLGDGLHLTLADVQTIAQVQQCKVFAWAPAAAAHWLDGYGSCPASEWIDLCKFAHTHWPDGADAPTYWLEPDVAELPADLLAKVVQAGASATSLRDGELGALRRHLDDVRSGREPTVPIHVPYCDAIRNGPDREQTLCDCGYEWPHGKD